MTSLGDADQSARYYDYLARIESAPSSRTDLGGLRQWVTAADLSEGGRDDLLGRVATYLGDLEGQDDPWEAFANGAGPLPPSDTPRRYEGDPDADASDALLDLEDGLVPGELPADA